MTVLNIAQLERADILRLATENGRRLTLTPLGDYFRLVDGVETPIHSWVVDSLSGDSQHFHDVEIWQDANGWHGECDSTRYEPDDDKACKANRLGARLCSHLARCLLELESSNRLALSFIGDCDVCNRKGVRVAYDGEVYRCIDQRPCEDEVAAFHSSLVAKDRKDIFGDVTLPEGTASPGLDTGEAGPDR